MGDAPSDHGTRNPEYPQGAYAHDDSLQVTKANMIQQAGPTAVDTNTPFYSQFSGLPQQQRVDLSRLQTGMTSYNIPPGQGPAGASFNMSSVASALPDFSNAPQNQRGPSASGSGQPANFRSQQMPQYPTGQPYGGAYGMGQFQGGMAHDDTGHGSMGQQTQRSAGLAGMQQQFSPYGQQMPQYYFPTSPFSPQNSQQTMFTGGGQNMAGFDRRTSLGSLQSPPGTYLNSPLQGGSRSVQGMAQYSELYGLSSPPSAGEGIQRPPSGGSMGSVPRGPPRKPKQSGHALWVGNLPPGTTVTDLKDHFSRDATKEIESLFLISKSNCAFVNYRTEASCAAAMQRFHDSRFHGVRLVCRLRRGSTAPPGVPSGPASMTGASSTAVATTPTSQAPDTPTREPEVEKEEQPTDLPSGTERVPDKFFVVKSLTLQDLELSVRNGIWATQAHNEETLNKAYQSADNVYLIFSANKSGEYFGYARMASPISEDATQVFGTIQRHEPTESLDAPRTIPTPATEFAPKGHIIDDSARGTIFWEADHSDVEDAEEPKETLDQQDIDGLGGQQAWGKPFKIEWMSTNRLPFYRTRGLRNPWNANREVKIARDGTELEPSVGNRLIQMFHRMGQPAAAPGQMPGLPPMVQMPPPQMGGPPQMRPF